MMQGFAFQAAGIIWVSVIYEGKDVISLKE